MSVATPMEHRRLIPDDLIALPDGDRYELVDGQIAEHASGFESSYVVMRVAHFLAMWCFPQNRGWLVGDSQGFRIPTAAGVNVRKPDLSFIAASRLARAEFPMGYSSVLPDLAVEVVSPHDLFDDLEAKVEEYLVAGVKVVWVVDPKRKFIDLHRPDGSVTRLHHSDELRDDLVLPGFSCSVGDVFA